MTTEPPTTETPAAATVPPAVIEVHVPGSINTWADLGFDVTEGVVALERCSVRPAMERLALGIATSGPKRGGTAAGASRELPAHWLGIPLVKVHPHTRSASTPSPHRNGVRGVDHIVVMTTDLDATVAAIHSMGWEIRRQRPTTMLGFEVVQLFVWAGAALLEVVCASEPNEFIREPVLWGVSLAADDLDATVEFLGERIGAPRDAVQKGRRIATVRRRGTDLGLEVAIMSPHRQEPGSDG
ncbi:MAG: hypothetical protein GX868_17160 [Actinobacteria bacterium]|nr:hypothetical protein [Actinomycetota bacterium]